MSNEQTTEQERRALDNLEAELAAPSGGAGFGDAGQFCEQYRKVRPFIEGALTFIEKIPVRGKTIANAIRFLMGIADVTCPQP